MLNTQTTMIAPTPRTIGSERSKPDPVSDQAESSNNSAWIREPAMKPLIASTTDQANQ